MDSGEGSPARTYEMTIVRVVDPRPEVTSTPVSRHKAPRAEASREDRLDRAVPG